MICVLYKYYLSTFRKLIIVADDTEIICDQYDQIFSKSCPKSFYFNSDILEIGTKVYRYLGSFC